MYNKGCQNTLLFHYSFILEPNIRLACTGCRQEALEAAKVSDYPGQDPDLLKQIVGSEQEMPLDLGKLRYPLPLEGE